MTNIITIMLAAAVAVLALLCCMLCYAIGRKDDRLAKLTDERHRLEGEISRLNNVIDDRDFQLLENDELIQNLRHRPGDGSNGDGGSGNR
ncbi:MAG: hypothetical protein IJ633_00345 [Prevotella sp.]|nr:hypothetical protein [Prevotella sp.]